MNRLKKNNRIKYSPSLPMSYYNLLCEKLFETVEKFNINAEIIGERFLELLRACEELQKNQKSAERKDIQHIIDGYKKSSQRDKRMDCDIDLPNPYLEKDKKKNGEQGQNLKKKNTDNNEYEFKNNVVPFIELGKTIYFCNLNFIKK